MPRNIEDPSSIREEQRLMARLGTDRRGVARILGVSVPIYLDFLRGKPYAKDIVMEKASHFVGDQRDFCGPYTAKKVIASGGFGEVSEVVNSKGISFASKSFKTNSQWGLSSGPRSSFYSPDSILELDVLSRVHHPNVLSARTVEDKPMVSKNKEGETCVILDIGGSLKKALDGGMPREKAAFEFMCGLNYLHLNSIIHRDLKVENCLVRNGDLVIIDFGLALNVEKTPVELFGPVGTPAYIDPSAIFSAYLGEPVKWNFSSDIYSAAWVLLYIFFDINAHDVFGEAAHDTMGNADLVPAYLSFLQSKGLKLTDKQMEITGTSNKNSNFLDQSSPLLDSHHALKPLLLKMLALDPDERPTAAQIIGHFEKIYGVACPRTITQYEASPVAYRKEYTPEYRAFILFEMTSKIALIELPLLACTSDILDRIVATSPELARKKEDLYVAGFIAKYLAFSVLGYSTSFDFGDIVKEIPKYRHMWKMGLEGPLFSKRIKYIVEKLNYRIFRPSVVDILNLPREEAKQFIYTTLSPTNIIA